MSQPYLELHKGLLHWRFFRTIEGLLLYGEEGGPTPISIESTLLVAEVFKH